MKFILSLLVILQTATAFSQNTLSGTITNKANKEALPGVLVYFPDLKSGVISDLSGKYTVNNLPKVKTIMQVKLLGYKTLIKQIDLTETQQLDFELEESVVEADEIVVTGTSHATELKRSPIPVISIDNKLLTQNTSNNIIEALGKVPGISSLNTGPNVSKPYIRGLGYNRILTLFDGVRQDGQQWGDEHGIEIDQFLIDRVEAVKGPASLIYGSDALAGVINLLPAHAASEGLITGALLSNYQSNNKQIANSLNLAGNTKGYVWGFTVSKKIASTFQNKYDGNVYGTKYDETDANAYVGLTKPWGYSRLNFSLYDSKQEVPDGNRDSVTRKFTKEISEEDTIHPIVSNSELNSYAISPAHQRVQHYRLYSDNTVFVGRSKLGIKIGAQQSQRREFEDPEHPSEAGLNLVLNTITYDIKYYLPEWKGFDATIGVNGFYQQNQNKKAHDFVIPDYNSFDLGPFVFVKKSFKKIEISAGVRYDSRSFNNKALYTRESTDHGKEIVAYAPNDTTIVRQFAANNLSYSGLSGSLGSSFMLNEAFSIKLNVGRGFRAPNISEISGKGVHPGTGFQQLGDAYLKPEFSLQEDLGLFYDNEHVSGSIELFNNTISNYIYNEKLLSLNGGDSVFTENGENFQVFKYKQTTAQLYGAEFSLDIHPHPLDWLHFENSASLTYGINAGGNGVRVTDSTKYLPLITPFHTNSEIRADLKKKLAFFSSIYIKAGLQYFATQDRFYSAYGTETKTAGYILIDAGMGFDIVNRKNQGLCSINISVSNLTDEAYQSNMSRLKYFDNYPNNHTGRSGIFNMGRNFSFKLTIPLCIKTNR